MKRSLYKKSTNQFGQKKKSLEPNFIERATYETQNRPSKIGNPPVFTVVNYYYIRRDIEKGIFTWFHEKNLST